MKLGELEILTTIELIEFTDFKDFQTKVKDIRKKDKKIKLEVMEGYIYLEKLRYGI